jgi:hypothetical protein
MWIVLESRGVRQRLEKAGWIANARTRRIRLGEIDDPYASLMEGIERPRQRVWFDVRRKAR